MQLSHGFVADGRDRAYAALEPPIRAQVTVEYQAQWEQASWWRCVILWWKIEAEIERRIERQAPHDALY